MMTFLMSLYVCAAHIGLIQRTRKSDSVGPGAYSADVADFPRTNPSEAIM